MHILPYSAFLYSALIYSSLIAATILTGLIIVNVWHKRQLLTPLKQARFWLDLLVVEHAISTLLWFIKFAVHKKTTVTFLSSFLYKIDLCSISYMCIIAQYQTMARLIQLLVNSKTDQQPRHKATLFINSLFASYLMYIILQTYPIPPFCVYAYPFRSRITYLISFIFLNIIIVPDLYTLFYTIQSKQVPKMVRYLLKTMLYGLFGPFLMMQLLNGVTHAWQTSSLFLSSFDSICSLIITIFFYQTINAMLYNNRSINKANNHFISEKASTIENFRIALEGFAQATSLTSLYESVFQFFKNEFQLPPRALGMHIKTETATCQTEDIIKRFIQCNTAPKYKKIVVCDEIAFALFYDEDCTDQRLFHFLLDIETDIFLPIYHHEEIVGFISIALGSRQYEIYSPAEQNRMIIFASFLGGIVTALRQNNINLFIKREKEFENELYQKHHEITLYKESMQTLFRRQSKKEPALFVYKKGKCTFSTNISSYIMKKTISSQALLNRLCNSFSSHLKQNNSTNHVFIEHKTEKPVLIAGAPKDNQQADIIVALPADISDILAHHYKDLKNKDDARYLLYLEKTTVGRQLSHMLPGSGSQLVQARIALLKAIISRKSFFLHADAADLSLFVSIAKQAAFEKTFHCIEHNEFITQATVRTKTGRKQSSFSKAYAFLQEKCLQGGTLIINNVEHLDAVMQEAVAVFVRYSFTGFFDDNTVQLPSIRIILSDKNHPLRLHQEGILSNNLFSFFKDHVVTIPTPTLLTPEALNNLIEGIAYHITEQPFSLTDSKRDHIVAKKAPTIRELYRFINNIISHATKLPHDSEQILEHVTPLSSASYLDRHALKEKDTLEALWIKFGNYHKIAAFLEVNPSSVLRRCKQFGIGDSNK